MAMEVHWYDFVCFGIVGVAFCGSLWVIWKKEGSGKYEDKTMYESLLVARPDSEGYIGATRLGHVSSSQLWRSCWRGVHPVWLLLLRLVSFFVMVGFLIWDVLKWDASIFIYYTEWTFSLVIVYFALGSCMSAYGCWVYSLKPNSENGVTEDLEDSSWSSTATATATATDTAVTFRTKEIRGTIKLQSHYDQEAFQRRAGSLGYLMQIAYQASAGAVILTDIVFWCVIVPFLSNAHLGLNMLMGCMHTLNAFFLILDASLNSLPFPWFRLSYFVLWSCIYVIFQWVIHVFGFPWWPYPFLELSTPWAPLWYFCVAVLHIPCYGIFSLIMKAKITIGSRFFPHEFVRVA